MITRRELLAAGIATGAALTLPNLTMAAQPKPDPKKILILGGTGFLGPQIVEAALARGHTLTLFNRGKTHPSYFPNVEKLQGDRDPKVGEGLKSLEGDRTWDAVIDTSGYTPRTVRASAELLAKRAKQYVFVSSISVYDEPPVGVDESGKLAVADDPASEEVNKYYGALKVACEKAVEEVFPGHATNVRPGLIVGPDDPTDRYTYWPARLAKGGKVACPGDGSDPVQYIDARDLGLWLVKMVEQGDAGTYNAAGPAEKLTCKEMLEAINTAAGNKSELVWIPADKIEAAGVHAWSDLPVWTGGVTGMGTVNSKKAIAKGLTFSTPENTATATLAWWNKLPPERQSKLRAGLKPEKEAELLKSVG